MDLTGVLSASWILPSGAACSSTAISLLAEPLATWRVHEAQQTAKHQKTGSANRERLQFAETFFAKPWIQGVATPRLWFTQIYYLRKQYGAQADSVVRTLRSRLPPGSYRRLWLRHKVGHPFQKLARRLGAD